MTNQRELMVVDAFPRRRLLARALWMLVGCGTAKVANAMDPLIPCFSFTFGGTRNCLPKHHYQHVASSPAIIVSSLPAVEMTAAVDRVQAVTAAALGDVPVLPTSPTNMTGGPVLGQRKRIRPNRASLVMDHCRVSDVVIDFLPEGYWWLSLMAEQNPPPEPEDDQGFQSTIHLRRNAFSLMVRLYSSGRRPVTESVETDLLPVEPNPGRLMVCQLEPRDFFVQRGIPRHLSFHGHSPEITVHYPSIESAEFEFRYRHDPLSAAGQTVRRLEDS